MNMDLVKFHQALLGADPEALPEAFLVSPIHRQLYRAFPRARGFSTEPTQARDQERLLATIVLALSQTDPKGERQVHFLLPKYHEKWVHDHILALARYTIQQRKGDAKGIRHMYRCFRQVVVNTNFGQIDEPDHWVAFGFSLSGMLPEWIRTHLIEV